MSTAAAAAAAAAAERQRREEEEMSSYSSKDLAEDWEFKIVRSNWGAFRKPEKLRAVLDEEARGGWVLVEKFDDDRIRLKRPAGTKPIEGNFVDGYDPYRTNVGMSRPVVALTVVTIAVSLVATMIFIAVLLSKR